MCVVTLLFSVFFLSISSEPAEMMGLTLFQCEEVPQYCSALSFIVTWMYIYYLTVSIILLKGFLFHST